jgi:hypothetical protein
MMVAAMVGGVVGASLCGCDGSKAPAGAGGAVGTGAAAGGPKRVDVEAETARMMARMPAETDGRRRVLDVADDLKVIIDEVRDQPSAAIRQHDLLRCALGVQRRERDGPDALAPPLHRQREIDRHGGALHYGAMATGSLASDVRFVPIDGSTTFPYHTPVVFACFARMRVSIETRDVRAFRESLDAVVAVICAMDLRPSYVDRVSADLRRGSLYRELCALMQARNEPMVHAAVAEAIKRLGPRDAAPAIESYACRDAGLGRRDLPRSCARGGASGRPDQVLSRRPCAPRDMGGDHAAARARRAHWGWARTKRMCAGSTRRSTGRGTTCRASHGNSGRARS